MDENELFEWSRRHLEVSENTGKLTIPEILDMFKITQGRVWYPAVIGSQIISAPTEWMPDPVWRVESDRNLDDRGNPEVISVCKICGSEIQHMMVDTRPLYEHAEKSHGITVTAG